MKANLVDPSQPEPLFTLVKDGEQGVNLGAGKILSLLIVYMTIIALYCSMNLAK